MSKKKIFIGLVVLFAIVLGGMLVVNRSEHAAPDAATKTVAVEKGNIEEVVTAQGKLEPKEYVDVGTQVSGQLKVLHVDIGSDVKKGDLLAEIDPRLYEAKLEADSAQLRSYQAQQLEAEASLVLARQQHARNQLLIKDNAISKDAFDISASTLKSADAKVSSVKAQVEQTQSTVKGDKTNLEYTKIYAPMTGTVVTLPAHEGQTLNASQTAPTLLQIADLDLMTIRAQVAEADVMRLKEGMQVRFTTLGSMEKKWDATVRQILPTPEVINDVVLYDVLIDVANKERLLMNGMSTQIFFELGAAEDVLVLPVDALGRRMNKEDSDAGLAYQVHLKNGDKATVHVGLMDRTNAEIKDGLKEGDEVAIAVKKPAGGGGQRQGGGGAPGGGMGGGPRL